MLERRLAAILAADVVGYSRMMGEDEADTLSKLRRFRDAVLEPALERHDGNLIKSMGDGWLIEFASAGTAVSCAIEIQAILSSQDSFQLRIGVHVGDITFEGNDLFGDGVNIAARLQEAADPGAIFISDFARCSIDGKLARTFRDLGPQELKNISEPVRVHGRGGAEQPEASKHIAPGPSNKPSIAVLPFTNMSSDEEQDFFVTGYRRTSLLNFRGIENFS